LRYSIVPIIDKLGLSKDLENNSALGRKLHEESRATTVFVNFDRVYSVHIVIITILVPQRKIRPSLFRSLLRKTSNVQEMVKPLTPLKLGLVKSHLDSCPASILNGVMESDTTITFFQIIHLVEALEESNHNVPSFSESELL
jgi:hypothetical protein